MRSITSKMILAFLGIGLISVVLIVLLVRWNTKMEFTRFVSDRRRADFVTTLADYYRASGSWEGVADVFEPSGDMPPPEPGPAGESPLTLADASGRVILASAGYSPGDQIPRSELDAGIPVEVDGEKVGTLIIAHMRFEQNPREVEFIHRINLMLLYSALGATAVALLLGIFLSRTLTRPIRELTLATHAVSEGDLSQQVPVRSRDELGELAKAFNKMSAELARSVNARRQMTADIAHELRTPLSLILGHAEAVHDGVLLPTVENFEIIREEAGRLENLVDDLRTLSLADAGELSLNPQPVAPQKLLQEVSTLYRYEVKKKNVTLELDVAAGLPVLMVDAGRMIQVLTNILENALRHTPRGGDILLSARQVNDGIELSIRDSGSGIASDDLERIFDRFYRTDASRHRENGGSGLGLAIAKSIVQAHNGGIRAESETGQGLTIIITLPGKT